MKKIFLILFILGMGKISFAQSLPLTAGSGSPLTGTLYSNISGGTPRFSVSTPVTGTEAGYSQIYNTSGSLIYGVESSTGSNIFAGSTPYATVIGADVNKPFQIATNNTIRQTIDGSGNVGIGTTSPGSKLDVNGNANVDGAIFAHSGETNTIAPSGGSISFSGAYSAIRTGTDHSWNIDVYNSGSPINAFKIGQNGNIGIGAASPGSKLDVNGNANFDGAIYAHSGETNTIAPSGGSISFSGAYSSIRNGTDHSWNIDVYNSGTPINAFHVAQNGNTGIGTTSLGFYKLAVNGSIRAKEVKVETGWSDFVFEPSYKLRSLRETEHFIKENKHLPEIPSAKEVAENGINLGEMNAKLLQKIEELTLYVIELKKDNDQFKEENKKQQNEIDQLKSR